ncbi:TIGR01458 family HAD-type hydrolase [Methanogenium organophilum]|uniref:Haloacid dehalogenase-like hydrolase domain-containing protein 2 n=1 Tax=Methanogenium organophilum TaxID=2199 RepID=A0A9X9T7V6_METOG|nr:TIGR01458 family HAD-type hydrolase [Methanogenium organophilum]WAI00806.1 TIGR01458 family HAD-type hydrolase [Methanogenium organophilum]
MECIKGVLLDIDGVLYTGDSPIPGAIESIHFLRENHIPFRCLSNTTRKSRTSIAQKLSINGLDIPEHLIFTPAIALVSLLKENNIQKCFFLTEGDVEKDLLVDGITQCDSGAEAVIVGDAGDNFDYSSMNTAFRLLIDGASLYALEKDRYWMDNGGLSLSAGPFVCGLEYASETQAHLVGKPSPAFFKTALDSMNINPSQALMVGDDIFSDIEGSQKAGMRGVLVKTGKFSNERLKKSGIVPNRIINSVQELPEIIGNSM